MKKVDLLNKLHKDIIAYTLDLIPYNTINLSSYDMISKGKIQGRLEYTKKLFNMLEAEEEVIKHEPDEIEWTGELIFFFENKDGSLIRANAIKGRFKYDGTYLCEYLESKEPGSSSPWFSLAYWDDYWVYDLGDEIKKSVHYDGIIIKELYLGD